MLKLYCGATSVCLSKVNIGLCEKGQDWESQPIDLAKREQNTPDYLLLNPKGVVPTVVCGDLVVVESSVILEYVESLGAGPRLMSDV